MSKSCWPEGNKRYIEEVVEEVENLSDIEEKMVYICEPELEEASVMRRRRDQLEIS
jgi:hypothetical protein